MLHKTLEEALAEFTTLHEFQSVAQGISPVVANQAAWLKGQNVTCVEIARTESETDRWYGLHRGANNAAARLGWVLLTKEEREALQAHQFPEEWIGPSRTVRIDQKNSISRWLITGEVGLSISSLGTSDEFLSRLKPKLERYNVASLAELIGTGVESVFRAVSPTVEDGKLQEQATMDLTDFLMNLVEAGIIDAYWAELGVRHSKGSEPISLSFLPPADHKTYWQEREERRCQAEAAFEKGDSMMVG